MYVVYLAVHKQKLLCLTVYLSSCAVVRLLFLLSLSVLSDVIGAVDKTSCSFSAHGKIGNFIIIINSADSDNQIA